jgi:hypothetical protein
MQLDDLDLFDEMVHPDDLLQPSHSSMTELEKAHIL